MRLAISKTIYPNGKVKEYKNGMELKIKQPPSTTQINKWFKEIHKSVKT